MATRIIYSPYAIFLVILAYFVAGCGVQEPRTATPVPVAPTLTPTARPTFTPDTLAFDPATSTPEPEPPTATPTATRVNPTPVADVYTIGYGDTLLGIAQLFGATVERLQEMNPQLDGENLSYGDLLYVPSTITVELPYTELVYDSEVVYGPSYLTWNSAEFIARRGGYLAQYTEGEQSAAEIIDSVAARYQVGPRVLIAAIEVASGWVTKSAPAQQYPLGLEDPGRQKLSQQLAWAARLIGEGYYGQLEGRRDWVMLENNVRARLAPGTTAGTAGLANLLARVVKPAADFPVFLQGGQWQATYQRLFGELSGGPVLPSDLRQPYLAVPWTNEEPWYFTGGPHGGYGDGVTGWAALDFAPPIASGCWRSVYSVRAVSPGLVISSTQGETWVDMDGDGDMRTGWVIFYMHLDSIGRVEAGTWVDTGDVMGYPSCEGGVSSGSHLHLARLYNGQWMPANGPVPFQLGDWQASALIGSTYDGYLTNIRTGQTMEACNCRSVRQNKFPYDVAKALARPAGP